jgi:hypothetical protein
MAWCLPIAEVEKFKKGILSGEIDPEKLADMSSAERRQFFADHLGDINAQHVNELLESKLLLKNRQAGYVSWARKMLGENTPAGRDVISRVERMSEILSPVDEKAFLNDLASKRLGTEVTFDEAKQIADLSKQIETTKAAFEAGGDRMAYGLAMVNLRNYVGELKGKAERLTLGDFKSQPIRSTGKMVWTGLQMSKALKAAWDASAMFRPGVKVLWTHPTIWKNSSFEMFKGIIETYRDKAVMDTLYADLLTRPNALNGYYKASGLDIGVTEEAYPTDVPERATEYLGKKIEATKVPLVSKVIGRAVGKTYKASQDAYGLFNNRTRADLFDKYVDIARHADVELDKENLEPIGRMVNSLVGRGRLGPLDPVAKYINVPFFSPRMLKSHLDVLFEPLSGGGGGFIGQEGGTSFVRKQSALNLLKILAGTAAVLGLAAFFKRDSVEPDPRSSNFGKIRIGDTRFDVTGGWASIAILSSRLASMKTKSSITGEVKEINERDKEGKVKFGAPTAKDLVYDFFENKYSPPAAILRDVAQGETRQGEKPTVLTTLRDLYEPLPLSNIRELKNNPNSAPILLAAIADALGIATNTYSAKPSAVMLKNKAVADELKRLKIEVHGAGTDDPELDKLANAKLAEHIDAIELPKGATDIGEEKILQDRVAQARAVAKAETALADPERYKAYLSQKDANEPLSFLSDEEKKTLTEDDLKAYRKSYAENYITILQRVTATDNYKQADDDKKEKILAKVGQAAHTLAKVGMVKTKRKGTP